MLVNTTSRYKYCKIYSDTLDDGRTVIYLGDREPLEYVEDQENEIHIVVAGDTLESIANRYFAGFPDPSTMWWIIAEFQPVPIFDPTLRLEPGSILYIPSSALVHDMLNTNYADQII